jgi:hypothetical protein
MDKIVLLALTMCLSLSAYGKSFSCNLKDMVNGSVIFNETIEMVDDTELHTFILMESNELSISALATLELVSIQTVSNGIESQIFGHLGLSVAIMDNNFDTPKVYYALCEIKDDHKKQ